jgi:hypothetical protein
MDFQLDPSFAVYKRLNKLPTKTHINLIHSSMQLRIYNTRIQLFSFFALAALLARVLARLEDCRHASNEIRAAWSALAVTVAFALAITYSLPCTMAAVSAGLNAAVPTACSLELLLAMK